MVVSILKLDNDPYSKAKSMQTSCLQTKTNDDIYLSRLKSQRQSTSMNYFSQASAVVYLKKILNLNLYILR